MTESLLNRLEAATSGSRALDKDIAKTVGLRVWDRSENPAINPFGMHGTPPDGLGIYTPRKASALPHYTTSLDAAIALVREVLPGWEWTVYYQPNSEPHYYAHVDHRGPGISGEIAKRHQLGPIALMICLLRAQEPTTDSEGDQKHG